MTAKKSSRTTGLSEKKLLVLIRSMTVLLVPFVTTAVLAMLRLLTGTGDAAPVWDVLCLVLALAAWCGAIYCARVGILGAKLPKTALVISGCLLASVLLYALAFAMEKEIFSFHAGVWAMGRLLGAPASVSAGGMRVLLGGAEEGTAAMLSGAVWLAVSFAAALPIRGKKKKREK